MLLLLVARAVSCFSERRFNFKNEKQVSAPSAVFKYVTYVWDIWGKRAPQCHGLQLVSVWLGNAKLITIRRGPG